MTKEHRYHMQMSNWNVNLLPTHAAAITKILTYIVCLLKK